jgi:hypothetical protein
MLFLQTSSDLRKFLLWKENVILFDQMLNECQKDEEGDKEGEEYTSLMPLKNMAFFRVCL